MPPLHQIAQISLYLVSSIVSGLLTNFLEDLEVPRYEMEWGWDSGPIFPLSM